MCRATNKSDASPSRPMCIARDRRGECEGGLTRPGRTRCSRTAQRRAQGPWARRRRGCPGRGRGRRGRQRREQQRAWWRVLLEGVCGSLAALDSNDGRKEERARCVLPPRQGGPSRVDAYTRAHVLASLPCDLNRLFSVSFHRCNTLEGCIRIQVVRKHRSKRRFPKVSMLPPVQGDSPTHLDKGSLCRNPPSGMLTFSPEKGDESRAEASTTILHP